MAPPRHDVLGGAHFTGGSRSAAAPASDGLSATELGYGVAGGVAVLAAAAAGVVALRHRPQLPRHA
ncbi:MAG TPA: hypothetical protein VFS29_11135 [Motilibacteraceae bacterium]|nr:hypothetical protein [Motilibacteraceae bacterium]